MPIHQSSSQQTRDTTSRESDHALSEGTLEKHEPGGSTGPIIFAHPTARSQFLGADEVFTFRENARSVGETHARWERNGKGKADATVEHAAAVDPSEAEDLMPYWRQSGFTSVEAWQDAIRNLNGWFPENGHVYRVTRGELRVTPKPDYLYTVGTRSTHESRHEAAGVAAILNGRRRRASGGGGLFTLSHYGICRCEEDHTSAKFPTCQLCGGHVARAVDE